MPLTGSGIRKVMLLKDKVQLYNTKDVLKAISDFGWNATYSPDLAPSDFYLQYHVVDSNFTCTKVEWVSQSNDLPFEVEFDSCLKITKMCST